MFKCKSAFYLLKQKLLFNDKVLVVVVLTFNSRFHLLKFCHKYIFLDSCSTIACTKIIAELKLIFKRQEVCCIEPLYKNIYYIIFNY